MDPNQPFIVVEGMEDIIERDLEKYKSLLDRTRMELLGFRGARAHEIKKKRHYLSLIGGGKFDDEALQNAIDTQINTNIQHFSDKCKMAQDRIELYTRIVDELTEQHKMQMMGVRALAAYRRNNEDGDKR